MNSASRDASRMRGRGLVALVLAMGMIGSMAGLAAADDIVTGAGDPVVSAATVTVWVVEAVDPEDTGNNLCNIPDQGQGAPHVTASVTSSDPAVAQVSPDSLTFEGCGTSHSQTFNVVVASSVCDPQSATITIAESSRGPGQSVKGTFNTATINVLVPGDPAACGGGGGGGGTTWLCSEPAAPAWAAALLKASTGLKAKAKDAANHISSVAGHMEAGAVFDGVSKATQGDPATVDEYPAAVRAYMVDVLGLPEARLASVAAARALRPSWTCTAL